MGLTLQGVGGRSGLRAAPLRASGHHWTAHRQAEMQPVRASGLERAAGSGPHRDRESWGQRVGRQQRGAQSHHLLGLGRAWLQPCTRSADKPRTSERPPWPGAEGLASLPQAFHGRKLPPGRPRLQGGWELWSACPGLGSRTDELLAMLSLSKFVYTLVSRSHQSDLKSVFLNLLSNSASLIWLPWVGEVACRISLIEPPRRLCTGFERFSVNSLGLKD